MQDLTALRRAELALVASERAMLTQHDVLPAERTPAARIDAHLAAPLRARSRTSHFAALGPAGPKPGGAEKSLPPN
ncbi:hypothetical protein [Streptomyces sp. NPDC017260]|uniref:hypothetical protein n=1 Tax=unclassified Streptomyces TaxID=2593676 RepID=UPI0037AEA5E8